MLVLVTGDVAAAPGVNVEWQVPVDLLWLFLLPEVGYSLSIQLYILVAFEFRPSYVDFGSHGQPVQILAGGSNEQLSLRNLQVFAAAKSKWQDAYAALQF